VRNAQIRPIKIYRSRKREESHNTPKGIIRSSIVSPENVLNALKESCLPWLSLLSMTSRGNTTVEKGIISPLTRLFQLQLQLVQGLLKCSAISRESYGQLMRLISQNGLEKTSS
jgi:hypothetical protein